MDAADLQDLRNQLQALVLDKITQDHTLHGATQAATIAQEESTTLRRHLATYKDTAERQEIELRETANQHKQEVMMMRKESGEVKLALESELAGLRASKLQHDHEVRGGGFGAWYFLKIHNPYTSLPLHLSFTSHPHPYPFHRLHCYDVNSRTIVGFWRPEWRG